ncbi:uncharacterized protein [Periplaneta americana]|uniref:uncharacterized protein isoform X6 n=1 Tax=Periplaneta americana TaxID=6978 RepID=UPI0037E7D9EB
MDVIKMKPEVDPLGSQPHDDTYGTEENKALLEERNISNLQVGFLKTEYVDPNCHLTSDINAEDSPVSFSFSVVKCEVEDTPVTIISPVLQSEVDEGLFDLDGGQQEQKVEVSSEEDEVLTEREVIS